MSTLFNRDISFIEAVYPGIKFRKDATIEIPDGNQLSSHHGLVGWNWSLDPYSLGGYSNFSIELFEKMKNRCESCGETTMEMYRPVEDHLFFAGEHTALEYPGTMEGAVESSERTARMIRTRFKI